MVIGQSDDGDNGDKTWIKILNVIIDWRTIIKFINFELRRNQKKTEKDVVSSWSAKALNGSMLGRIG